MQLTPKTKRIFDAIINKKGKRHQHLIAIEELSELQKELTKALRNKSNRTAIIEEISDVTIVIAQLCVMYDVKQEELDVFRAFKMNRLSLFYVEGSDK